MQFSKHTPDRFFKITVESVLLTDLDEDEQIPSESIAGLILELELLAAELKALLVDDPSASAN